MDCCRRSLEYFGPRTCRLRRCPKRCRPSRHHRVGYWVRVGSLLLQYRSHRYTDFGHRSWSESKACICRKHTGRPLYISLRHHREFRPEKRPAHTNPFWGHRRIVHTDFRNRGIGRSIRGLTYTPPGWMWYRKTGCRCKDCRRAEMGSPGRWYTGTTSSLLCRRLHYRNRR